MIRAPTILLLCAILLGCYDEFHGPKIRNGYSQDIKVSVLYEDGTEKSALWPPCRATYLGQKNLAIKEISFEMNGQIVHKFDREKIKGLLEAEKHDDTGQAVWTLVSSGIQFSSEKECPIRTGVPSPE